MVGRSVSAKRGFTLIELLVVVAIIALLISILLPSLAGAREQGKIAACLSNMRNVMTTCHTYFIEYKDAFPFVVTSNSSTIGINNFSFGGKSPGYKGGQLVDKFWQNDTGGLFFVRTQDRPFNRIILGRKSENDAEMPQFKCPSDRNSNQRRFNKPPGTPPTAISAYDDVGTSYLYNLYALMDTNIDPWAPWPPKDGIPIGWTRLGMDIVRDGRSGFSGRYALFYEEPVDWAFNDLTIERGHHGKVGKHNLAYLDGHAGYTVMDTRGWCGPTWVAINPNWVRRQDYRPEVYYTPRTKNCDPPK